ncbi:hypothetical protein JCM3774_002198 [Rhodotorula dairenensis]
MLDRLPVEIGQKILTEYGDGPWEVKQLVDSACLVSKGWRSQFLALRVPHLRSVNSLAIAREQPKAERDCATTIWIGTPIPPGRAVPDLSNYPAVPANDVHKFLALYPNARRAFLANLTESTLIKNETFGGEPVPFMYLQADDWRGFRDYVSLCAVNVALRLYKLVPTDVYALKHLHIELVADERSVADLEALLTAEHMPHLRTLQLGLRRRGNLIEDVRFPAPTVAFLDKLEMIQLVVDFRFFDEETFPAAYLNTSTPLLYTVACVHSHSFPRTMAPFIEYVQIDQSLDLPIDFFILFSLPNLKAIFVPHGFSMYIDPEEEDFGREILADFARRKVEFVYGDAPVDWTLVDPTFAAYLARPRSSP